MRLHQYNPEYLSTWPDFKITQGFDDEIKSLMTSNTPDTPHKWAVHKQETFFKIYRRDTKSA